MAESSSAETSIVPTPFAETSTSSNFSAFISEVESDSEANSNEAGRADVCEIIILCGIMTF